MRTLAVTIALIATALATLPLSAQRKDCKETQSPKDLPPVSALLDSARAMRELATLDIGAGMLFSLAYLNDDSLPLVRALYDTDSAAIGMLVQSARPQKPANTWGLRVRVAGGPAPSLRLERAVYCPPAPVGETRMRMATVVIQVQPGDRGMADPRRRVTIRFEALISSEGVPVDVKITQSSGYQELDDEVIQETRRMRYRPAVLDGLPIDAWYKTDGQSPRL